MSLPDGPLLEVLLGGSDVVALRQVLHDLLADPAAVEDAHLGVGEAPLQVGHDAVVRWLLAEIVGVLQVELLVGAACAATETRLAPCTGTSRFDANSPRIGPPFPVASMGWPWRNSAARLTSAGAAVTEAAGQRRAHTTELWNRIVGMRGDGNASNRLAAGGEGFLLLLSLSFPRDFAGASRASSRLCTYL